MGSMPTVADQRVVPAPRAQALGLLGFDHLEWWVGNARAFAGFLCSGFGFEVVAYAGPETGRDDRISYVVVQNDIRWVVTSPLGPASAITAQVATHGDGVHDIALRVRDAAAAYDEVLRRGAAGLRPPEVLDDRDGRVVVATVATYGDTQHTFVERSEYDGPFLPGFEAATLPQSPGPVVGLDVMDHVVGNVELGHLGDWVGFYERVFGFDQLTHFDDEQISTEYSALMSTVVWDGSRIVMPINEPAPGRRKSQIEEYLDYYGSPGVQHIALGTTDIVAAVRALRQRGVRFLEVPAAYYEEARDRMAGVDLPWADLADLGVLVDRDHDGHLLQIFSETVAGRPTVFFEIIQRAGARGFGEGNFKALFEAIEREQERRGNL
ncbi:MAG: hppD [Acidimicrobiales bacterium]|jgi:4-hydroxyphenylpyruvate dioxygenase|nr:hppD [Acidimicrobiales bacterium]